jgi:hypothetical protein
MKPSKLFAALILAGLTTAAAAEPDNLQGGGQTGQVMDGQSGPDKSPGMGPGSGQHPHGPPTQAIAACKDRSSGASCSFVGRENQTLSGTCFSPGENHALACRPDRAAQGAGGRGMGAQGLEGQSGTAAGGLDGGY